MFIKGCLIIILITKSIKLAETADFNFHQHDFEMKFERVELVRFDKAHVAMFNVVTFKYNRTWAVTNVTFEYAVDVGNNLEVITQAYKFASNEYRTFPIRFEVNYCEAVSKNYIGLAEIKICGNFTGCGIKKGIRYHMCNFAPDQTYYPPYIPNGQYMLEFQGLYNSIELFVLRGYGVVSRPIVPAYGNKRRS